MERASSRRRHRGGTRGRAAAGPLLALFCCAPLAACDSSSSPSPQADALQQLLSVAPPQGYTADTAASGALDLGGARVSTPADPDAIAAELGRDGFDHGWADVWVNGGNFVTFEVLRVHDAAGARSVVALERTALQGSTGYVTDDDPQIPDSVVYTMFSTTRSGGRSVFCQGVWFPMSRDVFGVTTCSALPAGGTEVEQLAVQQYAAAAPAEGLPPPSPLPTAAPS